MESIRTHVPATKLPTMLLALALAFAAAAFALPSVAQAADVKSSITIKSVTMQDEDGNDIDLNKSDTDTAAYTNGLRYQERFGFAFTFDIDMGQTALLQDGDTAEFPISYDTNSVNLADTTAQPLYATGEGGQQTQIGTWQVNASQRKIVFTFNDTAKNSSTYTNGVCKTERTFVRANAYDYPEIRNFGVDNVSVKYLAEEQAFPELTTRFASKLAGSASNNKLTWSLFLPNSTERYLTEDRVPSWVNNRTKGNTWLQGRILHKNVFLEDSIGADNVTISAVQGCIRYPINDTSTAASINTGASVDIKSAFTEIKQSSGESIDDFRARVKSSDLQYGVYDDGNGTFTAMVYLGTFPSDNLKWEDPAGRWSASSAINKSSNSAWTEGRKEGWLKAHDNDNVIDGDLSFVRVVLQATYPVVDERTQKENTATFYHENDNNNYVPNTGEANPLPQTATGYIAPGSSDSVPAQRSVKLIKYDVDDDSSRLSGAAFKLERKSDSSDWVDWSDSQGIDEWTTDSDGMLLIEGLVNGDYRFVESGASSDEYDIDSAKYYSDDKGTEITNESHFTIANDDSTGILIYCSNEKLKYGSLVVKKTVAGNAADASKAFDFTVTLTNAEGTPLASTTVGEDTTDADGKIAFSLADGQSKTITAIPAGTKYEVAEADYSSEGYTTTKENESGEIAADESTTVTFTNTKNTTPSSEDPEPNPNPTPDPAPTPDPEKLPLLNITKNSDIKKAKVGDEVPYAITVSNTGEGDATNVEIVDTMADGLEYVSDDANGMAAGQTVIWTVDVAAGETKTIHIICKVGEGAKGSIINSVLITPNDNIPVVPQEDSDEETITISTPSPSLTTGGDKNDDSKTPTPTSNQNSSSAKATSTQKAAAATADAVGASTFAVLLLVLLVSGVGLHLARTERAHKQ